MSELTEFAARLIEASGGLVETEQERVTAVLGEELATALGLPEEVVLAPHAGAGAVALTFGSELLERLLGVATGTPARASVRLRVDPPGPALAERAAARFVLRNGISTAGSARVTTGSRLVAHALLTLKADEQHRQLIAAAVSTRTVTPVEGFEKELPPTLIEERRARDPGPVSAALGQALAGQLWRQAAAPQERILARMQQRYERDRQRIHRYFWELQTELQRRAEKGRVDEDDRRTREAALDREREAKLADLHHRFRVQALLQPVALLEVEAPVLLCDAVLRRRKAERRIELEYDAATRAIVPPRCDACGGPAPRPAACDDAFHLLCEECLPESAGRPRCPVCK